MNGKAFLTSFVTTWVVGYFFTSSANTAWNMAITCVFIEVIVGALLKKKRRKT